MRKSEIFQAYAELPHNKDKQEDEPGRLDLRTFIENYAASLPSIIRAFPKDNLDINALEAHLWDRLKAFYQYASFGEVAVETKEEQHFINEAIRGIEDWFYDGAWTSCLEVPNEEQLQQLFSGKEKGFLQRTRQTKQPQQHPNLGRERRLPNIYNDAASGYALRDVYTEHAFKFFHGPAGVINTLTKIRSRRGIVANESKFRGLISATSAHYHQKLEDWGYDVAKTGMAARQDGNDPDVVAVVESEERMRSQPSYIRSGQEFQRPLFFCKTSLIGAELIRRTGEGKLTQQGFQDIMTWRRKQMTNYEQKHRREAPDFIPFDFVPGGSRSSIVHVNTKELPFALFAVDHMKDLHDRRK
ncbi:MAG: hypothetical protein WC817_01805 [Patescibacteria group bacterium]|jgi:hypothetical protein